MYTRECTVNDTVTNCFTLDSTSNYNGGLVSLWGLGGLKVPIPTAPEAYRRHRAAPESGARHAHRRSSGAGESQLPAGRGENSTVSYI